MLLRETILDQQRVVRCIVDKVVMDPIDRLADRLG